MNRTQRIVGAAAIGVVIVGAGAGVAVARSDIAGNAVAGRDDGDKTVTGAEADRATKAALDLTDGGRANAVERDSENGATWEVEVTRTDGTTVDVRLDDNFALVVIEDDSEKG